jgi:hypothetical protein
MLFAGVWPDPALSEDGCGLRLVEASAGEPLEAGTWCVARDELRLASSDGTDPRVNGRRYALRMPAYVAWLERQPIDLILREAL